MKKILLILFLFMSIGPIHAAVDGALSMEAMQAQQEGNLTKQHIVAQKIISKNPEDPYGYSLEADLLFKTEKYEEAILYYTKAINAVKTVKEQDGIKLRRKGVSDKDIAIILNFNSSLAKYYNFRGICKFELNKEAAALNDFISAEKFNNEKDFSISLYKALCFIKLARYGEAKKELKITKRLAKSSDEKETTEKLIQFINKQIKLKGV